MIVNLIQVPGTQKFPFACVIKIDNIWVTNRICDKVLADNIVRFALTHSFDLLKKSLAIHCIELRMIK